MNTDRFWGKVEQHGPDDCWPWKGTHDRYGYGRIKTDEGMARAHNVAYRLVVGDIPVGKQLDHTCHSRDCVNPSHLEPVTSKENTLRGDGPTAKHARKTHCPRGHAYDYTEVDRGSVRRRCRQCTRTRQNLANENARLREALREIAEIDCTDDGLYGRAQVIARRALAAGEGK